MRIAVLVLFVPVALAQERPDWIARLSDVDARVRIEAARALQARESTSAGVVDALAELRHDEDPHLRVEALIALVRVGEADRAVPFLPACLLGDDAQVSARAWRAVLAAGEPGFAVARDLIRDAGTRASLLTSLDALGGEDAAAVRAILLFDPSWIVRRVVAEHCATLPALEGGELGGLVECALHDRSTAVRMAAIPTLSRWVGSSATWSSMATAALREVRDDPDPRIRLAVLRAVPPEFPASAEFVRGALDDPHPGIVVRAILALRGRAAADRDRLRGMLGADRPEIATAAALALAEEGERDAAVMARLVAALDRTDVTPPWQRRNLRAGGGAPRFEVSVPDPSDLAISVLTRLGAAAVGPILEHARGAEADVRIRCVLVLAGIGEVARGALEELAGDPDSDVVARARRALAWLDDTGSEED